MEISVVIPAYNAENFIALQLEALLGNSLLPHEIIVSDNGSNDRTRKIVLDWGRKNSIIRCVDSSLRRGVSYARNIGCLSARGKFILICDADDIVAPNWVEKMSAALRDAEIVGSGHQLLLFDKESSSYYLGASKTMQPQVFEGVFYNLGASIGFRSELFNSLGGFDTSYQAGHDEVDFCLRAAEKRFKSRWIPEPLIQYRQRLSEKALARQSRNYGRTWVQLIINFTPIYDQYLPSLKLMLRKTLPGIPQYFMRRHHEWNEIRGFWWNIGVLEGVVKYQILKAMPARRLI